MVESFGPSEVRALSSNEADRILSGWVDEPPIGMVVRAAFGVKPPGVKQQMQLPAKAEMTPGEYDDLVARMKANAEAFGRRRN